MKVAIIVSVAVAFLQFSTLKAGVFAMNMAPSHGGQYAPVYPSREPAKPKVTLNLEKMPHITFLLGLAREILTLAGQTHVARPTPVPTGRHPAATTFLKEHQTSLYHQGPATYPQLQKTAGYVQVPLQNSGFPASQRPGLDQGPPFEEPSGAPHQQLPPGSNQHNGSPNQAPQHQNNPSTGQAQEDPNEMISVPRMLV